MEQRIGIKDLIRTVTRELRESQEEREKAGEPVLFRTKELEIEVSFVVEKQGGADAKFDVWVVSVGTSGFVKSETVHRMKLSLSAVEDPPAAKKAGLLEIDMEKVARTLRPTGSAPSIGDGPSPLTPAQPTTFPFPDHRTPDGTVPGKYPGNPLGGVPPKPGPGGGGIPPLGGNR